MRSGLGLPWKTDCFSASRAWCHPTTKSYHRARAWMVSQHSRSIALWRFELFYIVLVGQSGAGPRERPCLQLSNYQWRNSPTVTKTTNYSVKENTLNWESWVLFLFQVEDKFVCEATQVAPCNRVSCRCQLLASVSKLNLSVDTLRPPFSLLSIACVLLLCA